MLNSQGRNLGHSVTFATTSVLSSIQGDLGESSQVIVQSSTTEQHQVRNKGNLFIQLCAMCYVLCAMCYVLWIWYSDLDPKVDEENDNGNLINCH